MDTYFKPIKYENFQEYKKEVKNQLGKNIKILNKCGFHLTQLVKFFIVE